MNLQGLTIKKTHELYQKGEISSRELVSHYQDEIKKKDPELNAYRETFDDAFETAEEIDKKIKGGDSLRVLEGVPFAIKDNILIKGKMAGASSKILEGYTASYDSGVIKRLREEGAIFLGRTNMDEFAMGSSTENSAYGATKNPRDVSRVPGGSSGGSAVAVAGDMALAALGSDTGGSIRQPAAFCGVVGLKPTYGAVSRSGLIAMASSLDQIGPLAKTVEDAEIIFNVIKGKDEFDATSVETPITKKREPKIIGVPREYFSLRDMGKEGLDEDIAKKFQEAVDFLKESGFEIKEVSLPSVEYALAAYYIIMPAEVSSNLARFDGVRYGGREDGADLFEVYAKTRQKGFGPEARRRVILGTYVLSAGYYDAYYARAQKVRHMIRKDFENEFNPPTGGVDLLLTPTTPHPAFKIGEKASDPLAMYLEDIYTVPINLAGVPAISVPFGEIEKENKKLPVGVQLIAPWFCEKRLFEVGKILENKLKSV